LCNREDGSLPQKLSSFSGPVEMGAAQGKIHLICRRNHTSLRSSGQAIWGIVVLVMIFQDKKIAKFTNRKLLAGSTYLLFEDEK
jgi:hypothetical protein